ncbi:MAG: hypothetical protein LUE89_08505 [Clostridiales bacterium]|nr:hypothetical protein [Clostridiales bacterium]
MAISAASVTILLVFFLVLPIGAIVLQIFLSRMESRIPGLILPVLYLVGFVVGTLYATGAPTLKAVVSVFLPLLFSHIFVALALVLPIALLLLIYYVCRRKYRRQNQMDKMRIQDL